MNHGCHACVVVAPVHVVGSEDHVVRWRLRGDDGCQQHGERCEDVQRLHVGSPGRVIIARCKGPRQVDQAPGHVPETSAPDMAVVPRV